MTTNTDTDTRAARAATLAAEELAHLHWSFRQGGPKWNAPYDSWASGAYEARMFDSNTAGEAWERWTQARVAAFNVYASTCAAAGLVYGKGRPAADPAALAEAFAAADHVRALAVAVANAHAEADCAAILARRALTVRA